MRWNKGGIIIGIFDKLFQKKYQPTEKPKQVVIPQSVPTPNANITTVPKSDTLPYSSKYLKDFSHRPISKGYYTSTEAVQLAPKYLKTAEECTNIVNSTKDQQIFFVKYDMLVYYLIELKKMESLVNFTGKSPSEFLNEVIGTREEQIRLFIYRRFEMAKRNIEVTTYKKAKIQQYDNFNYAMKDIDCELSESNRADAVRLSESLKIICEESEEKTLNRLNKEAQSINLQNAKLLDTDLVEADHFKGCCGECAKYRGRWFSISGKDKRFPKMPVDYGCTCPGIDFYPVIFGISEPNYCNGINIIEYSNRPFVDDRNEEEKRIYEMSVFKKNL